MKNASSVTEEMLSMTENILFVTEEVLSVTEDTRFVMKKPWSAAKEAMFLMEGTGSVAGDPFFETDKHCSTGIIGNMVAHDLFRRLARFARARTTADPEN